MSVATRLLTADELDQFPDDGKRREIIAGVLYVSPAPARRHQELSSHLHVLVYQAIVPSGAGMVYAAPVDVRISEFDQVQPDILAIRNDRLEIYRGHIVHGAPDIVVEILSPSNPSYDEVEKLRLYAEAGVPEYWILDPALQRFTIFQLRDMVYEPVEPVGGMLRSTAVSDFEINPDALFAKLSPE